MFFMLRTELCLDCLDFFMPFYVQQKEDTLLTLSVFQAPAVLSQAWAPSTTLLDSLKRERMGF